MSALEEFTNARDFLLAQRSDYEAAYRGFRPPKLDRFNWALDYFDSLAKGNEQPALWIVEEDGAQKILSFRQLSERSNQVANYLRQLGVSRGDCILLMMGNEVPLWELMLAAIKLGAVLSPATTLLTADDLNDRIVRGKVRVVVTPHVEKFATMPRSFIGISIGKEVADWHRYEDSSLTATSFVPEGETKADDPLFLYFTSGTTSKPKLVLHSHQSYPVGHLSTMYWIGLQQGDIHWNISSPGWAKHAWSCFFAPWNAAATVFIYNYARFKAADVLQTLVRHGVTTLCAPPTVWRMLIQEKLADYPVRLREVIGAGEPLNPEIIEQVRAAWGLTIRDGYGQTETCAQIGNSPGSPVKPGSMGRPLPGYRVELLDAEGQPSAEGEICLDLQQRPLGLMQGYAGDEGKSAEAMHHGYYHTGDVASRDADGYITYVGRADDVFKASDYRISPFELESVLIEHPAVAEAAVVPSPDPLRLAVPKAFIILAAGYQPSREVAQDIFRFTREKLAPFKRIRRLEFSDLPKTISGKIRRVDLRKREEAKPPMGGRAPLEFFEEDF
ncbi:acetyl-coenzyme A synthetase [mine drainage metagenome]|uniref:Acetyl-coenzyme A synthetase n=1 Tax=mine drainage metagenome TaxID=410659 RepID=A0A1J5SLJ9_9ZZZZ